MNIKERIFYTVLIVCSVLFFSLFCFHEAVWGDEAFTLIILNMNFSDIIKTTAADVHPPLYYLFAKIVTMIFGIGVPVLKVLSVVPIIATMLLGITTVKRLFGGVGYKKYIPTMFIISLLLAPGIFYYALELRMYSLALFFVTYHGLLAYDLYFNGITKKRTVLIIIIGLCAAYTHYFALCSVAFMYIYLFVGLLLKSRKNILFCIWVSVLSFIGYFPWLIVFIKQLRSVSNSYWIPEFSLWDIMVWFTEPFRGSLTDILLALFIVSIVILLCVFLHQKDNRVEIGVATLYMSLYFVTVLMGTVLSMLIRPIFQSKYAFPCLGLLWLGLIIALQYVKFKKLLILVIFVCLSIELMEPMRDEYHTIQTSGESDLIFYIETSISEDTTIITDIGQGYWILPAYFPTYEILVTEDVRDYNIASINKVNWNTLDENANYIFITRNPAIEEYLYQVFSDQVFMYEPLKEYNCTIGYLYLYKIKILKNEYKYL